MSLKICVTGLEVIRQTLKSLEKFLNSCFTSSVCIICLCVVKRLTWRVFFVWIVINLLLLQLCGEVDLDLSSVTAALLLILLLVICVFNHLQIACRLTWSCSHISEAYIKLCLVADSLSTMQLRCTGQSSLRHFIVFFCYLSFSVNVSVSYASCLAFSTQGAVCSCWTD